MSTRWLSDPEQRTWRRLAAVLELLPGALDSQLTQDEGLTHFDYLTLAMLSDAPQQTLRMTRLAELTHATLARLSNVVRRLEVRGFVRRTRCPEDGRATNASLTADGWAKIQQAAPGHVATVQRFVFERLNSAEVDALGAICAQLLEALDPEHKMGGPPAATDGAAMPRDSVATSGER